MNKRTAKKQPDPRGDLRREVMKGVDEIRRGEGIVYDSTDEIVESVLRRTQKNRTNQKPK